MINRDYGDQQSVTAGMAGIDQMNARAVEEKRLAAPTNQAWADYIYRLISDPNADPKALALEARNNPEVQSMIKGLSGAGGTGTFGPPPAQPAERLSQVGPGSGPGYPALAPPGGVNPAHGPQSLGQVNQQAHGAATGAIGYNPPSLGAGPAIGGQDNVPFRGGPMQGVGGTEAMVQNAQPLPSPQITQQQAGARALPPSPPPKPVAPPAPRTMSNRDAAMIAPHLPGIEAAQSRERVANAGGDVRLQVQQMKNNLQAGIATLKAQGKTDEQIVKMLLGTAKEEGTQERFVESEKGKTERAKIGAEAQKGTARIRNEGGNENTDLKVIADQAKSLRSLIASYSRADKTFILPGLNITLGQAEQDLARYDREIASRTGMDARPPNEGPALPPRGTNAPPAKAPPPVAKPGAKGKMIRVRKGNQTGMIEESKFDPAIHVKL